MTPPAAKRTSARTGKKGMVKDTSEPALNPSQQHTPPGDKSAIASPLTFVTFPRPIFDFCLEHGELDEDEIEDHPAIKKALKEHEEAVPKMWLKPADEFPDWPWKMSKKATKLLRKYTIQIQKRDQDMFAMHVYNDFSGYGIQEVIENQLLAWESEFSKKDPSPYVLWPMMECLGYFLNTEDMTQWNMLDDGKRVGETLHLIGTSILSTLHILERSQLLTRDSSIANTGMVISIFLNLQGDFQDAMSIGGGEQVWPAQLALYAKKHDIDIQIVHNTADVNELVDVLESEEENLVMKKTTSLDKYGFKTQWKSFVSEYGKQTRISNKGKVVGGSYFDITKMPRAERIKASLEGRQDPLKGMPKAPAEDVDTDMEEPCPDPRDLSDSEWADTDGDDE